MKEHCHRFSFLLLLSLLFLLSLFSWYEASRLDLRFLRPDCPTQVRPGFLPYNLNISPNELDFDFTTFGRCLTHRKRYFWTCERDHEPERQRRSHRCRSSQQQCATPRNTKIRILSRVASSRKKREPSDDQATYECRAGRSNRDSVVGRSLLDSPPDAYDD